jgi:hypothetical protein
MRSLATSRKRCRGISLLEATLFLDAAVLACNLGEDGVPVADRLVERHVPFVFSTGICQERTPARFADFPVLKKPYPVVALAGALPARLK